MQSDQDILIQHLKIRANDPNRATWMTEHYQKSYCLYPTLRESDVRRAEMILGFEVPPLLARVYQEIGNGGWGPGYGLLRLIGPKYRRRRTQHSYTSAVRESRHIIENLHEYENSGYKEGLLLFCDYGCTYYSVVDCHTPEGVVWGWDYNNQVHEIRQANSLFEWFEGWIEGRIDGFGWLLQEGSL